MQADSAIEAVSVIAAALVDEAVAEAAVPPEAGHEVVDEAAGVAVALG